MLPFAPKRGRFINQGAKMNEILDICKRAKAACSELLRLDSKAKFEILNAVADELLAQKEAIKAANAKVARQARHSNF